MGQDEPDVSEAIFDLDDPDQVAEYIGIRLEAPREETEPSGNVLDPETGESRPGFKS